MIEFIIKHFDKIAAGVLTGVFGGYVAYRTYKKTKRTETGKDLITAFDTALKEVKTWDGHGGYLLIKTLSDEFEKQKIAARDFRRYLGSIDGFGFDNAWKEYHGGNEDYPDFKQYLMPETWPALFLERVNKILKYAQTT